MVDGKEIWLKHSVRKNASIDATSLLGVTGMSHEEASSQFTSTRNKKNTCLFAIVTLSVDYNIKYDSEGISCYRCTLVLSSSQPEPFGQDK